GGGGARNREARPRQRADLAPVLRPPIRQRPLARGLRDEQRILPRPDGLAERLADEGRKVDDNGPLEEIRRALRPRYVGGGADEQTAARPSHRPAEIVVRLWFGIGDRHQE